MKTASILLALVVVLGFMREAGAACYCYDVPDPPGYTINIGKQTFGFTDCEYFGHWIHLGPFGSHEVPFTATQGLIGCIVILAMPIILSVAPAVRWKRRSQ